MSMDDFVTKAKDVAEAAGKKTGEIIQVGKLRYQIARLNGDLKRQFEKMGKHVFDCKKAGCEPDKTEEYSAEASLIIEKIKEAERKITEQTGKTVCGNCSAQITEEAVYCLKCGSKI